MPISLIDRLADVPLAFVDVETTGSSPRFGERITEIGILRLVGGEVVERYDRLVNPQWRISPGVAALTGITDAMVAGEAPFAEQASGILACLKDAVIVGHNVRFDLGFLAADFRRCGCDMADELGERVHVLDTVRLARKLFGRGGNGLQRLAPRLGLTPGVAHRAMADCETTYYVLKQMLAPLGGWSMPLVDVLALQGGPVKLGGEQAMLPLELEEAISQKQPVEMEYLDARGKRTSRKIQPLKVYGRRGSGMLVAHCHMRDEQRTFRLDRVVTVRSLTRTAESQQLEMY